MLFVFLQERGIRSGTVPASLAVGLGVACDIAQRDMVSDTAHIRAMAERLQHGITSQCDGVVLNGPQNTEQRYVGNMNLSFSYVEGESLIMGLKASMLSCLWCMVLPFLPGSAKNEALRLYW